MHWPTKGRSKTKTKTKTKTNPFRQSSENRSNKQVQEFQTDARHCQI